MTPRSKRRPSSGYRVQKWSLPRCMLIPRSRGFTALLSLQNEGNHRSYNERRPLTLRQDYPLWRTSSGLSRTSGAIKNSSQVRHKQTLTFDVMLYLFIHLLFVKYFRFMSSLYPTWSSNSQLEIKIPQPGQTGTPVPCFITLCFLAYLCIQLEH